MATRTAADVASIGIGEICEEEEAYFQCAAEAAFTASVTGSASSSVASGLHCSCKVCLYPNERRQHIEGVINSRISPNNKDKHRLLEQGA
uniref:Uncharacterized protein n=1 Tax=Pristionchus pacificus TaxID=54126 RepID=A0A2A6C6T0_PRIPA|eukprot:PDM73731.1 hypothetical protein PRIPAC_41087 [Pristionchus pacificus]